MCRSYGQGLDALAHTRARLLELKTPGWRNEKSLSHSLYRYRDWLPSNPVVQILRVVYLQLVFIDCRLRHPPFVPSFHHVVL